MSHRECEMNSLVKFVYVKVLEEFYHGLLFQMSFFLIFVEWIFLIFTFFILLIESSEDWS
jgi:hypothetical protein